MEDAAFEFIRITIQMGDPGDFPGIERSIYIGTNVSGKLKNVENSY